MYKCENCNTGSYCSMCLEIHEKWNCNKIKVDCNICQDDIIMSESRFIKYNSRYHFCKKCRLLYKELATDV